VFNNHETNDALHQKIRTKIIIDTLDDCLGFNEIEEQQKCYLWYALLEFHHPFAPLDQVKAATTMLKVRTSIKCDWQLCYNQTLRENMLA
jgi:hypothetical protein